MKINISTVLPYLIGVFYLVVLVLAGLEVGFLKLIPSGLVSLAAFSIVNQLKMKVVVEGETHIYNPVEALYYIALMISEFSGFALYKNLDHNDLGFSNHKFTLIFLIIYFIIPGLIFFYSVLVNQNDKILLDNQTVKWVDNKKEVHVSLSTIVAVETLQVRNLFFYSIAQIKLELVDGQTLTIPTHKMNFSAKGVHQVVEVIKQRINQ